ncbi:hypothetical protein P7K49_014000 [Saguinus oedipus]|uniref:Uncharacterized protein n=1 Tax=Saguinus oedipus TaxID=9490 RepID=A0ABQ9VI35_SAGOE|nr:hypothetical protein P7K49_014000 [Saguinus oedipus]
MFQSSQSSKQCETCCISGHDPDKSMLLLLRHPRFFNQLSTGLDIIGLAGEWLTSTANTNIFEVCSSSKQGPNEDPKKTLQMCSCPRHIQLFSPNTGPPSTTVQVKPGPSVNYKSFFKAVSSCTDCKHGPGWAAGSEEVSGMKNTMSAHLPGLAVDQQPWTYMPAFRKACQD